MQTNKITNGTLLLIVIWIVSAIIGSVMYLVNPGKGELGTLGFAIFATIVWGFTRSD